MIDKTVLRSALQLAGLCLAVVVLSTTPVQGFDEECEEGCQITFSCTDEAASCDLQCGETVTWQFQYYQVHNWYHYIPELPTLSHWHEDNHAVYNYQYGSGIENFECDELAETSSCSCRYR